MILQGPVDPFPDPVHAGQEIENIGLMFGAIAILIILVILMIYLYSKRMELPIVVVFGFSIIFGIASFPFGIPFTPYFQIFFMLFQGSFFIMKAMQFNKKRKR